MLLALALWSPSLCFVELATPRTMQPRQVPPVMILPPGAVLRGAAIGGACTGLVSSMLARRRMNGIAERERELEERVRYLDSRLAGADRQTKTMQSAITKVEKSKREQLQRMSRLDEQARAAEESRQASESSATSISALHMGIGER